MSMQIAQCHWWQVIFVYSGYMLWCRHSYFV